MDTLRIAFATPEYVTEKYFAGGIANYLHRLAKSLFSLGHEVHIITLSQIDSTSFISDGIQIHRVMTGKLKYRLDRLSGYRLPITSEWLDFSFAVYQKLKQLNRQQAFDIVQFPNYSYCGLVSSLLLPIPYVVRISSYTPVWNHYARVTRNLNTKVREWLELLQLKISKNIYAPSYTLQKILSEEAKINNVEVIRTPFYLETKNWDVSIRDKYVKNKEYLLFFGRFQRHKGFHTLICALPQFLAKYPDAYAVFVGKDYKKNSTVTPFMKDYAISLCQEKDRDRLIFIDCLTHDKLYPIIADAKLVVLPSLIDNLPNACLEAMALSKPVIGTIGASFEEMIIDEKTGFLVLRDDAEALKSKIDQAWNHPDLSQIGRSAMQAMQNFSPERTVQNLVMYYQSIIEVENKYSVAKLNKKYSFIGKNKTCNF